MAKVTQPIKEFWDSNKKPTDLEISKRRIGEIFHTHVVRIRGKTLKNKKKK